VAAEGETKTGVVAVGQLEFAAIFGLGQLAAGFVAIDQFGLGRYVLAQLGLGQHVWDMRGASPVAQQCLRAMLQ